MNDKFFEISNAVDIWKRGLWGSRWCDSRHLHRRSTIAVVHCGDPLGKLVSLGSPRVTRILWEQEVSRSSWRWCDSALPHTAHCTRNLLQNSGFSTRRFSYVSNLEGPLARTLFHLTQQGGIRSVHPLWQIPRSSSVLLWKVEHQWHIYCVLLFTSIKILPLICNLTFWSAVSVGGRGVRL
jgi:hypothetical protein